MNAGRVVVVGAVHEAAPALQALLSCDLAHVVGVVTCTADTLAAKAGGCDLAGMAAAAGVPVLRHDDANDPVVVDWVRQIRPDLLVVVGWNQIVRPELLAVPHRGCVGFHASLLPRHRGHAPVNWAILRGETETGNTMMLLDPGVDTGDIVDQTRIAIDPGDTCASIYDRVGQTGARMLVSHLAELLDGRAPRHAQSRDKDRPLPRRVPEMGVIDWNRPAREVHDWIRALTDPYPGAFTFLRGKTVMVWEARRPSHNEPVGEPGVVLALGADGLRVGVHAGSIVLNRMSDAGSRPSDAADWAAHARVSVGTRFDPVAPTILAWARSGGPRPAVLA